MTIALGLTWQWFLVVFVTAFCAGLGWALGYIGMSKVLR